MEAPIKRTQAFWDKFFIDLAQRTAELSKDPNRQVGAVLVSPDRRQVSFGYNGLPADCPDLPSILNDKQAKQPLMVHAEDNCLKQSPFSAAGCTLYVTRFPCDKCAALIAAAKVARVVAPMPDYAHVRWGVSWLEAATVLGDIPLDLYGEETE